MKLNKKIKYSLSILGLTGLSIVPLSLSLIGCSKSDNLTKDKKESRGISQEFDPNFFEDTVNIKNVPKGVDVEQYELLQKFLIKKENIETKISKKLSEIRNGFLNKDEAKVYAGILLDELNEKKLKNTLLLNFNKSGFIEMNNHSIEGQSSQISAKKSIYTIKKFEYDEKTKNTSFLLEHNYDSVHSFKMDDYGEAIIQLFQTKLAIEFKNLKLKPDYIELKIGNSTRYVPIFTIDIKNKDLSIKYLESETKVNIDDYLKQELKFVDYLNSNQKIDKIGYDKTMEFIEKFRKYWSTFGESTNNIKNLDFSDISFIDNSQDIYLSPFLSKTVVSLNNEYNNLKFYRLFQYSFGLGILDDVIERVELNNNYSLRFNSIVRTKFGIPAFNFINIENPNDDFFFISTDENAITIPNPYFDYNLDSDLEETPEIDEEILLINHSF